MTGLTPPSRRQIEQDTKQYGGKYSGELHEGVTHLISLKPEGKKYEYAIKNNIKVVSPLWHTDCVERCGQVNPSKYQLEGIPAVRSAQAKGQVMGKGKGKAEAEAEGMGSGGARVTGRVVPDGAKISESESKLEVNHDPNNSYLDGCRVYLHGFRDKRQALMVKIIRAAGGTKVVSLDDRVTHVVFPGGNLPGSVEQQSASLPTVPQIVTDSWLVACAKESALMPTCDHIPAKLRPIVVPEVQRPTIAAHSSGGGGGTSVAAARRRQSVGDVVSVTAPSDSDLDFTSMFDGDWGEDGSKAAGEIKSPNPEARARNRAAKHGQRQQQLAEDIYDDDEHEPVERDRRRACRGSLLEGFKIFAPSPSPGFDMIALQQRICQHGGEHVESAEAANCLLVNLMTPNAAVGDPVPSDNCRVATFNWIDWCMLDVRLYDPGSSFLFQPCPMPSNTRCFRRARVCTSGFDELAKRAIESLCFSVGADVTQKFKRKANSHLICFHASGQKYMKSLQWNVPAVRQDWLFDSVQQGRLLNTADYLVTDPLPQQHRRRETALANFWTAALVHSLTTPAPTPAPALALALALAPAASLTTALETTQSAAESKISAFRPEFCVDEFMNALDTPKAASGPAKVGKVAANDGVAADSAREDDSGALTDLFSSGLAQANHRLRDTGTILKGAVIFVAKKLQKRPQDLDLNAVASQLGATISTKLDESCTHFVFKGRAHDSSKEYKKAKGKCHVVAPEWLTETLRTSVRQVEADYPHTFNPKRALGGVSSSKKSPTARRSPATPFDKIASSSKKARLLSPEMPQVTVTENDTDAARSSPSRARQPSAEKSGADESMLKSAVEAFISNHRATNKAPPRRSRLVSAGASSPRASKEPSSSVNVCSISAMERTGSSSRKPSEQAPEQDASNQNTEDDVTMLFHSAGSRELYDSQSPGNGPEEEYSQAAVVYDDPDRDERQRMIAQLQLDNVEGGRAGDELDEEGAGTEAATYVQAASAAGSPAASTAGDGKGKRKFSETEVVSGNSRGAQRSRKLLSPAAAAAAAADDDDDGKGVDADSAATATVPQAKTPSEYRVLLSALDNTTKKELCGLVRKLGGTILESRNWDVSCTHLVIGQPSRSEKYLAACAAGKWVVRPEFLRKSAERGSFVAEDEHEVREQPPSKSKKANGNGGDALGKAPKRWRMILANDPARSGAFSGWKVMLYVGSGKMDGFRRLLSAGDAGIVEDPRLATHLFVETGKEKDADGKRLIKAARATKIVKVLKADFISQYLQEGEGDVLKYSL